MTSLSVLEVPNKRRRFSPEYRARIIEACRQPQASVAAVALAHGLNANLVHKWIRKTRQKTTEAAAPAFVPLPAPSAHHTINASPANRVRIEIPRGQLGTVVVEWPLSDAATCQSLLRELLR